MLAGICFRAIKNEGITRNTKGNEANCLRVTILRRRIRLCLHQLHLSNFIFDERRFLRFPVSRSFRSFLSFVP